MMDRISFLKVFDTLVVDVLKEFPQDTPQVVLDHLKKCMSYNVPGGKLNRGLSVIDTLCLLMKGDALTEGQVHQAAVLGWCVEWLQASFLVTDDVMDESFTRRGQPCWFRCENIGNVAINDALFLESAIYILLRKHFHDVKCYVDLLELFHRVTLQTELGQTLDMLMAPSGVADLNDFISEKYAWIVKYKTAYYSFYLPVALALCLHGTAGNEVFEAAERILLPLGEYFQVQDDYLDCYGDPEVTGKIGTDIEDNKCSWLIVQALTKATLEQKQILKENYGKKDPHAVTKVKSIYEELNLKKLYQQYEESSYMVLQQCIAQLDPKVIPQDVFTTFMNKIYKRFK